MKVPRTKGFLAMLAAISPFAALTRPSPSTPYLAGGVSGRHRTRFNLGGLPPKWKGKRQARINRGGR